MERSEELRRLRKKNLKLLVLDEAQAIKNHKTSTWKTVRGLKADHCIAMSGTPVENRLLEYWAIMEAANPGLLGVERKFKKEYADPIEVSHNQAVADQFKRLTEPFILRRLKSDKSIIKDLPDKIVKDDYCVLTPEQAALYQETVDKNLALINEGMDRFERSALVIQMIMQLKQICNAPIQFEKSSPFKGPEYSGKMERLFAILDDLFGADKKVLIFTQFRQMGHLLEQSAERTLRRGAAIYSRRIEREAAPRIGRFFPKRSQPPHDDLVIEGSWHRSQSYSGFCCNSF